MLVNNNRVFFHVTLKQNIPSIMKKGLIPKGQIWDKKLKAVFFFETFEQASKVSDTNSVILEVQIPDGLELFRLWNKAFLHYNFLVRKKIPPTNIKIKHEGEAQIT